MAFTVDGSTGLTFPNSTTQASGAVSGLVFISSQTVSSAVASVDFTSGISSTYDDYLIIIETVTSASASAYPRFRLYQSGAFGTAYATSAFSYQTGGVVGSDFSTSATSIGSSGSGTPSTSTRWSGTFNLFAVNTATSTVPTLAGKITGLTTGPSSAGAGYQISGATTTAAVVTGFQFFFSTGNVASGTIRLYGIVKS